MISTTETYVRRLPCGPWLRVCRCQFIA